MHLSKKICAKNRNHEHQYQHSPTAAPVKFLTNSHPSITFNSVGYLQAMVNVSGVQTNQPAEKKFDNKNLSATEHINPKQNQEVAIRILPLINAPLGSKYWGGYQKTRAELPAKAIMYLLFTNHDASKTETSGKPADCKSTEFRCFINGLVLR